jgi:hypothetical protein
MRRRRQLGVRGCAQQPHGGGGVAGPDVEAESRPAAQGARRGGATGEWISVLLGCHGPVVVEL